jgi:hypothetical protein
MEVALITLETSFSFADNSSPRPHLAADVNCDGFLVALE